MSQNILLALSDAELRAGDRVLGAILLSDHPMVHRVIDEALGSLPPGDFRKFAAHLHGALLSQNIAHDPDCVCEACMDESFGSLSEMPSDAEEQRDAVLGDLGVPSVKPDDAA